MKTRLFLKRCTRSGYALLMVMVIIAVSLLLMASTLNRTYTVANLNNHSNQLILCQNAAEAAVEKVFARMQYDFQSGGGPATGANNLATADRVSRELSQRRFLLEQFSVFRWQWEQQRDLRGYKRHLFEQSPRGLSRQNHCQRPNLSHHVECTMAQWKQLGHRHLPGGRDARACPAHNLRHLLQRPAGIQHVRHHDRERARPLQYEHLCRHKRNPAV